MHVDDDKQANVLADSQGSISGGSNNEAQAIDWTEEEERKLVRRYSYPA